MTSLSTYLTHSGQDSLVPPGFRKVTKEERDIVEKCLGIIESQENSMADKGLDTPHFMFGVCNTLFVAWSFGAIPAYLWIVYLAEACVLFPLRWQDQVRALPLKRNYDWVDFCWFANFTFATLAVTLLAWTVTGEEVGMDEERVYQVFGAVWGIACGPLLLATGLTGNALVFHDMNQAASCLIHMFPSLVMYTLRWEGEAVQAAWPKHFQAARLDEFDFRSVYFPAVALYLCWLVPYTLWLLVFGMNLPDRGYDTIFHFNMRGAIGGLIAKAFKQSDWERQGRIVHNDFTRKEAVVYMVGHIIANLSAILVAVVCYKSHIFHCVLCLAMLVLMAYNGASRYTDYIVKASSRSLRREFGIPQGRRTSALDFLPMNHLRA